MTEPDKQEKYRNLKRATVLSGLGAIFIFIFDSFMLGAPMISVFVVIYLIIYVIPVTLMSVKNKPRFRFYGYKLVIYAVLVFSSFGFHSYDISIAKQRSEVVIAAVNQYHQDKGRYPGALQNLVPAYLSEIPRPRIAPGVFYYVGAPENPHLMFVDFPPFGRASWSFSNREWIYLD